MDWLAYDFVRRALLAGVLAGALAGVLGPLVVLKRLVALGGGLAHAAFAGVGLFLFLGFDPRLGAALVAVLGALLVSVRDERGRLNDALIGVLWSSGMAVGLLFVYLAPGYAPDLGSYLFGSLLVVSKSDVLLLAVLLVLTLAFLARFRDELTVLAFDPELATVRGLPARALDRGLLVLVALATVLLLQIMGVVLVVAMFSVPTLIARHFTRRLEALVVVATVVSVGLLLIGLATSFAIDLPPGPTVVLVGVAFLALVSFGSRLRRRRSRAGGGVVAAALLLSFAAFTARATVAVAVVQQPSESTTACDRPKQLLAELARVVERTATSEACNWRGRLDPSFANWRRGGSENLPVIAAATALWAGPEIWGTDYVAWWGELLEAQLDGRGAELPEKLRYFKGSEPFSNTYDAPVSAAVAAVRLWGLRSSDPRAREIAALAGRYLRATVFVYALVAVPSAVDTGFRNHRDHPLPNLQRDRGRAQTHGPYVALAGARSDPLHWGWDARGPFLARALGIPFAGDPLTQPPEELEATIVLDRLQQLWPEGSADSLYGLRPGDVEALRRLHEHDVLPLQVDEALRGIATIVPFHLVGWSGVRLSVMEENPNSNTQATYAVAYWRDPHWTATGREAVFLFPFGDSRAGITRGWARFDRSAGTVRASNAPGSTTHAERRVELAVPAEPPLFHLFLDQRRRDGVMRLE
jgi:zinc transport system permease protein